MDNFHHIDKSSSSRKHDNHDIVMLLFQNKGAQAQNKSKDKVSELGIPVIGRRYMPDELDLLQDSNSTLERGNYRGLKLLDHVMKGIERVIEKIIRERISIDDMQFGFMPGRGTTDAIFILRQLQEKHLAKNKKLYFAFVDLEKAFDRVPRKVI